MKMMCIKNGEWSGTGIGPVYGEIVTVIDVVEGYYILSEYYRDKADGLRISFIPDYFIPLSSIDETEMVREKQTEKV